MPLVPSLTFSVKGIHSLLTRLARAASLHAGNLHKALEGLGGSQGVSLENINLSRPDVTGDDNDYDNKERGTSSKSDGENDENFLGVAGLCLQDKGWISPPDSICSSSSESGVTSAEASLADSFSGPETMEQLPRGSDSREAKDYLNSAPFSGIDFQEILCHEHSESKYLETNTSDTGSVDEHLKSVASSRDESVSILVQTSHSLNHENSEVKSGTKDEASSLNQLKVEDVNHETPRPTTDAGSRVTRGKNAYAMSVLRRVEMKLDGRDIADNRAISIAEQVDYLLKQATSVDNLCNIGRCIWGLSFSCTAEWPVACVMEPFNYLGNKPLQLSPNMPCHNPGSPLIKDEIQPVLARNLPWDLRASVEGATHIASSTAWIPHAFPVAGPVISLVQFVLQTYFKTFL
ncbi:hypothetical protein F0562_028624 [Nyssa sinensis]|uniref:FATC domain-containing protein n=1 Tax=Nyssa sinensis TaxID=561372 RepID=A0A5J5B1T9_9ASTE|nr:hypothetical protein F0562_028624 [Nyssa sinensis]